MLHVVLAIGSAVALGSSLAFGRKSRILRRKRYPKGCLNTEPQPNSQESSTKSQESSTNSQKSSNDCSRDLYQDAKKKLFAVRKAFAISMGGTQSRDEQLRQLNAQQGKDNANGESKA